MAGRRMRFTHCGLIIFFSFERNESIGDIGGNWLNLGFEVQLLNNSLIYLDTFPFFVHCVSKNSITFYSYLQKSISSLYNMYQNRFFYECLQIQKLPSDYILLWCIKLHHNFHEKNTYVYYFCSKNDMTVSVFTLIHIFIYSVLPSTQSYI